MAISKKQPPNIVENAILDRIIKKLYDDINEIINAVNQGDTTLQKLATEGKAGDIRVVKDAGGKYYLEAKTDEGWIQSIGDDADYPSGFKFKER